MKTFILFILGAIALYGFIVYLLPSIKSFAVDIYLRCLSNEAVENYFLKQYSKYKESPKRFSDDYVKCYVGAVQCSVNFWQEMLEDAQKDRFTAILEKEISELDEEIELYQEKLNFWNEALIRVSNDNAVRQYHASLRNS